MFSKPSRLTLAETYQSGMTPMYTLAEGTESGISCCQKLTMSRLSSSEPIVIHAIEERWGRSASPPRHAIDRDVGPFCQRADTRKVHLHLLSWDVTTGKDA